MYQKKAKRQIGGVKTTHAQRKKGQKRAGRRTCTKNKGTEKSRPQLLEVQDKGLDQFFTRFTDFTRMASWTSGQVEFWQDRHANQIASGVQGGLLVYILVVPTAVDPADRQPIVYDRC